MKHIKTYENENIYDYKPSDFAKVMPMSCIFYQAEYEIIASNIMIILERTGNQFRKLSWREYKKERLEDGDFTDDEKYYFNKVIEYCTDYNKAKTFSKNWKKVKSESQISSKKYNL